MTARLHRPHGNSWIVGLDLQPSGDGALEFARWIKRAAPSGRTIRFVGVHVLESFYLYPILRHHKLETVVRWARETLDRDVADADATKTFDELHVLQGGTAEQTLQEICQQRRSQGLIVGRHAAREGRYIVRLGRVARRALREIDRPTFIVPPDFTAKTAGQGPIVVATNLDDASVSAVNFARTLGRSLGKDLLLVHVIATPQRYGARYLPSDSLEAIHLQREATAQADLESWAEENGFGDIEMQAVAGSVVGELLTVASGNEASMLVVGSRRLATWERVLLGSVAGEVAATATSPVAVVPTPTPSIEPLAHPVWTEYAQA